MRTPTFKDLQSMSDVGLIARYDQLAQTTEVGLKFLLDEIRYREASHINKKIASLTRWVTSLTVVVTIATIVNVIVFINDSPTIPEFLR